MLGKRIDTNRLYDVVSLDPKKIRVARSGGSQCVVKKTSVFEYQNYCIANTHLSKSQVVKVHDKCFTFAIPELLDWNTFENEITLDYIDGTNLETLLKDIRTHSFGVEFVNAILGFFIDIKFYWLDFAPRNIIISFENNVIYLVDFEKGFLKSSSTSDVFLALVIEEYICFVLPAENTYKRIILNISRKEEDEVLTKFIYNQSRRLKSLKSHLQTNGIYLSNTQLYSLIIELETPYIINNNIVFPIVKLDYLMRAFGYDFWAFYVSLAVKQNNRITIKQFMSENRLTN